MLLTVIVSESMHEFNPAIAGAVSNALKRLLSDKHLYQAVEPDLEFIPELAQKVHKQRPEMSVVLLPGHGGTAPRRTPETIARSATEIAKGAWIPYVRPAAEKSQAITTIGNAGSPVQFELPTINSFCDTCQDRWPFNPVTEGAMCVIERGQRQLGQLYLLGYQCQQCKGIPIRFLVRRDGPKLRLTGRDPIEVLPTPKALPKNQATFYGDAQIAYHAGQTLAGLFLLRTFVEQFWRSLPEVQTLIQQQPRATGDEQGTVYQANLPLDFKNRFPSLSDIYAKLSAAIHEARADAALFDDCCGKIVEHFEARRLFKLQGVRHTPATSRDPASS